MSIDFEAAKARVSQKLAEVLLTIRPQVEAILKKEGTPYSEIDGRLAYHYHHQLRDAFTAKVFAMLFDLSDDSFWHAVDDWSEIAPTLASEERDCFSQLMIEQARRSWQRGRNINFPIEKIGHCWIVKAYDHGLFPDQISDELLREAVTMGFWEFTQEYFDRESSGTQAPWDYFDLLMKYSDHLDLAKVAQLGGKPIYDTYDWASGEYRALFERQRPQLSIAEGAWLARPIVDRLIRRNLGYRDYDGYDDDEAGSTRFARQIASFRDYLGEEPIQGLFREKVVEDFHFLGYSTYEFGYWREVEILIRYIAFSSHEQKRQFISDNLPWEEREISANTLVRIGLPRTWLTDDCQAKVTAMIGEELGTSISRNNLWLLQSAFKEGWLAESFLHSKMSEILEGFLAAKRRPSGQVVLDLLQALDPQLIEPQLYRRVIDRAILDLELRKKPEEAVKWRKKFEAIGSIEPT